MRVSVGLSCRVALRSVLLAILMSCGGCQTATTSLFMASGDGWRVEQGQALWRPARRFPELGGELVVASHEDGRCLVQFAKTPLPMVLVQTTRTNWLIEFPPRRMRFALLYLPAALAGDSLPASFRFQRKPDGGWRLENTRSGETVEGFLAREATA